MGNPDPPLDLADVRQLLRLDRVFYSSNNEGLLRETVHRLKLAGKQVIERPSLLIEVIKKFDLKALWLPDRKRILIDEQLPKLKQRWGEAHEMGHSLTPWHEPLMHGDQFRTLSVSCHQQLETEANFAAGRMLFLRDRFVEELNSRKLNIDTIKSLHDIFGNTITSTLWRAIESRDEPTFGLIGVHPQMDIKPGEAPVRHFLRSRSFAQQFSLVGEMDIFNSLRSFCYRRRGLIGEKELVIEDSAHTDHCFFVQVFHNSHDALCLGMYRGIRSPVFAMA